MIAVLLEPASPYQDQYSLVGVTITDEARLIVEIVGPGFDASDILRGDLGPHERWEVVLGSSSDRSASSNRMLLRRTYLATTQEYTNTVTERLCKVGARIENPAFPDTVLRSEDTDCAKLAEDAVVFLKKTRQLTLLKHARSYSPIPEKQVKIFAKNIVKLLLGLSSYGIHLGPSSFAASVMPKRGLVFWDFFPARKQEAASLYPSRTGTRQS
jgi:hypothetical protein